METKFARLRASFMLFIFSMSLLIGGQAWAQSASLDYEKAALVSKFTRYVSWPAEARQRKFVIGVYEDFEKYQFFRDYFANKSVKGKDIEVHLVKTFGQAKNVHILYISKPNQRDLSSLADRIIRSANVLIITEDSNDISKTMIDISYNKELAKLDFQVINANIDSANLTMADVSDLLDDNKDDNKNISEGSNSEDNKNEEILSESPAPMPKNEHVQQLTSLQSQLARQKSALTQLNNKLNLSEKSSEKYNLALQQKSARLAIEEQKNTEQSLEIKSKEKALKDLEQQLQAQKIKLATSENSNQVVNEDLTNAQAQADIEKFQAQEQTLADLAEKLKQQEKVANNAVLKLSEITKENNALSSFQSLFYIFLLIAIVALLVAFIIWKKAKTVASPSPLHSGNSNKTLLAMREEQLIKSESFAALGDIATDITYEVGLSLSDSQAQLESAVDANNVITLKPVVTLLNNFNLIAADQDDTEIRSFDVITYIQKMIMLYKFEFNHSDIDYTYTGEKNLTIKSVPSYIALVLLNVINNSLKHGFDNNGNGKIALKVEKGIKSGAKITYSDDGKGMSKATLDKVFEPFFTTQSSRGYVGVGMSTTYDIVKNKLAGDIKIESKEGKGTTVTITLP